ncbi:MAG: DUF5678 domain-containing protein [Chloroflexota bacterium]
MDAIELRPDLREQVEIAARHEARSVDDVVNSAVADYVRDQQRAIIAQETCAFERMHADLVRDHRGQWVAIHDGRLVDVDPDAAALYARIRKAYGRESVLIRQVLDVAIRTLTIQSPRLASTED